MALVGAMFGPEHFIVYGAAELAGSPETFCSDTQIPVRLRAAVHFYLYLYFFARALAPFARALAR